MGFNIFRKHKDKDNKEEYQQTTESANITAKVITYVQTKEYESPQIQILCDFHNNILPMIDSIIWIRNKNQLFPYKVIRYDYIENGNEETYNLTYIVVVRALPGDIINNFEY